MARRLALCACLFLPALALAGQDAAPWIENSELCVERSGPDGARTLGEVLDSADYQRLLLMSRAWDATFILDLNTNEVVRQPLAAVAAPDGLLLDPAAESGTVAATFFANDAGEISFYCDESEFSIVPAPPLIGEITREELFHRLPAYGRRTLSYRPNPASVRALAAVNAEIEIVAFFGSWCQLCKHHLPALLSALDAAENPHLKIKLVAVDEEVMQPAELIETYQLGSRTPAFIARFDGIELGRIEEEPVESIEADLAVILAEAP